MGGAAVEVSDQTTDVVIEAAHFDPISIARTSRRHKLSSEASRRFERGVDPTLGPVAARRCADLLVELAGGTLSAATTQIGEAPAPTVIDLAVDRVSAVVGVDYTPAEVVSLLEGIGADVDDLGDGVLRVTVPSWRPDLTADIDLVEEVARTGGYDRIPSIQPAARAGSGLTEARGPGVGSRTCSPRTGSRRSTATRSPRRSAMTTCGSRPTIRAASTSGSRTRCPRICRSCARPCSRRLLDVAVRNFGRGAKDVALFEAGLVSTTEGLPGKPGPRFLPGYHPTEAELEEIYASVPAQPYHFAGVVAGHVEFPGLWGKGRRAEATDVIDIVRRVGRDQRCRCECRDRTGCPVASGSGGDVHARRR